MIAPVQFLYLTCTGLVLDEWAFMPWQRLLKGLREVEETPADDDIVVESHKEAHLQGKRVKSRHETNSEICAENNTLHNQLQFQSKALTIKPFNISS